MPSITEFSINNSRLTILALITVAVAGVLAFVDYPRQEDPSIVIREAVVTAQFPGMSTVRVEDLITRKLEEKIREMPEVDDIKSDSKTGSSIIHVVLHDRYSDLGPIWQDLRNKMNDVVPDLPAGTIGPFVNDEFGLTAVATVAIWSDGFSLAEMREVARKARDRLYSLTGIKKVEIYGIQDERIFLELSNAKMAQFGISPGVIVGTLQQQNIILPGGKVNVEGQDIVIEPSGNFNAVSEIESVIIPIPGTNQVTPLRDLVTITRGYVDPPDKPDYFTGRPAIVLSVSISEGTNSVVFGTRLTTKVKQIEQSLPIGYVLEFATYQPDLVKKAVNGAVNNVYQSLIIVLVVVMIFLGVRTGLIVGSFVPMAMLFGLVIMWTLDIEMQRMSIASMIIALGMLVDNGIVIAEDIRARMDAGEERREAAIASGKSLSIPLLTASLTTVLAFTPMMLAEGGTGEYTLSLGQVVTIVLLASWFLAMFMTPAMCFWFMKDNPKLPSDGAPAPDPYSGLFYRIYRSILETILRMRLVFMALVLVAMVVAGYGFRFVVQEFFPVSDRNQFLVYLDLEAGSHVNKTTKAVEDLTRWMRDKSVNPEITGTAAYVGSGGPRFFLSLAPLDPDPHIAFIVVNTETAKQVPGVVQRVRTHLLDNFPDVLGRAKTMWLGASETGLIEVRISGPDANVLLLKAEHLMSRLRAISGTVDIKQDWENRVLNVRVLVDQARARRAGVTSQEVANSLNAYIDGTTITDYREGDTNIPVVLRGIESDRHNIYNLRAINVYSKSRGTNVPLSQIAEFQPNWELSRIKRRNQERTIAVSAKHQFLKAKQLFAQLRPAVDTLNLKAGYHWEMGGEIENQLKAQGYLFKSMPACFFLIVILLVWQFNSFRRPAIILLTIPLVFIGVVIGLLVMKATFGFMVILGLLSLAGIIINNGIVLIDRIDIERNSGMDAYDAVVAAALARFRPILMTTLTTVLGLMPLIVSRDPLFYGMASAIAFGLAVGTVLTLGVVPILYTLFFRISPPKRIKAPPPEEATLEDEDLGLGTNEMPIT